LPAETDEVDPLSPLPFVRLPAVTFLEIHGEPELQASQTGSARLLKLSPARNNTGGELMALVALRGGGEDNVFPPP
jgi:hypothetical protein